MTKKKDEIEETDIFGVDEESTNFNYTIQSNNDDTAATVKVSPEGESTELFSSGNDTTAIKNVLDKERLKENKGPSKQVKKKVPKSFFKMKMRLNTLDKISLTLIILSVILLALQNRFTHINFDWFIY